ncbi:bZIP transcription factor 12-like isoform X2 [Salvia splendens]|uniref:bZIP transcription factor 12-like isoform X2 n=1 Tax=Salvia splendens TaxID=180675 RepID=UPI001C26EB0A|nr:bZIP transcription factor 12-like isoform X2 [Salvia splendens]
MLMASSKVIASRSPPNSDLPRDSPTSSINIHFDQAARGFGSMNMDEIFRNIYPDSTSFDSASDGGVMNGKTVEEVWRDIVTGGGDAPMTLEAFLTKAGAVNEEDVGVPAMPPPVMMNPAPGIPAAQFAAAGCVQSVIGVEFGSGRGKRRAAAEEVPLDKATQQKQRRMIKNRESAARSRERKQAYTVEMEAQVTSLEEEHEMLLTQEAEMNRKRYQQAKANVFSRPFAYEVTHVF